MGLLAGLVAALVLAIHWPVLSAGALSFDDQQYLTQNYVVQNPSLASAGRFLGEVLTPSTVGGYYQPLTMISLMLDCAAGGSPTNLRPFHRTSLALHVANTVLIIVLLYMLFGKPWVAAMVGLMFGAHPMTVEPIAWIGDRKTLLAAFFALWSVICYARFARQAGNRWVPYGLCLLMCVLALMSKPTTTLLPGAFLLLDFWPLHRLNRRAVVEKVPFLVIAGISAIITVVSQGRTAEVGLPTQNSAIPILLGLGYNISFYLFKIVWPTNLAALYLRPDPLSLANPSVLAAVLATFAWIAALLVSLRWTRAILTGWLIFFVVILPTMGGIGFTIVIASDKYAYLPSVGLLLPLAWFLGRLWDGALPRSTSAVSCFPGKASGLSNDPAPWLRPPAALRLPIVASRVGMTAVVLMLATAQALATRHYLVFWQDTERLCRRMLSLTPNCFLVHSDLGSALLEKGKTAEAVEHFTEALRLRPDLVYARMNLGNALMRQGKPEQAVVEHRAALRAKPNFAEAHNNLGLALAEQGKLDEAIEHFTEAVRLKAAYAEAHDNLGVALMRKGRHDEAIAHFSEAIALAPNRADWHVHMAQALEARDRPAEAIEHYRRALHLKPDSLPVLNNLAWILATRQGSQPGGAQEAVRLAERACERTGWANPDALDTAAAAYAAAGRFAEAVRTARKGIDLAAAAGRQDLATQMRQRLSLYEAGRPYLTPPRSIPR